MNDKDVENIVQLGGQVLPEGIGRKDVIYIQVYGITGEGAVSRNPDQGVHKSGSEVTLVAEADDGWTFDGWTGDLEGVEDPSSAEITVDMDRNRMLVARFVPEDGDGDGPPPEDDLVYEIDEDSGEYHSVAVEGEFAGDAGSGVLTEVSEGVWWQEDGDIVMDFGGGILVTLSWDAVAEQNVVYAALPDDGGSEIFQFLVARKNEKGDLAVNYGGFDDPKKKPKTTVWKQKKGGYDLKFLEKTLKKLLK